MFSIPSSNQIGDEQDHLAPENQQRLPNQDRMIIYCLPSISDGGREKERIEVLKRGRTKERFIVSLGQGINVDFTPTLFGHEAGIPVIQKSHGGGLLIDPIQSQQPSALGPHLTTNLVRDCTEAIQLLVNEISHTTVQPTRSPVGTTRANGSGDGGENSTENINMAYGDLATSKHAFDGFNKEDSVAGATPFEIISIRPIYHSSGYTSVSSPTLVKNEKLETRALDSLASSRRGMIPHVLTVHPGENVVSKVMSFYEDMQMSICILSAGGDISDVVLGEMSATTSTYEGRFPILSLSGLYLYSQEGGQSSGTGGLSVILSGLDGRVLGGRVKGVLTASSVVQLILASFVADKEIVVPPIPSN